MTAPDLSLYYHIVENSQGLICVHDLDGNFRYISPASALELGYSPKELLGRPMRQMLAPEARPLFDEYLGRIRAAGRDHGLLRLRRRDGAQRIWGYRNVLHREDAGEAYVIGHAVDVTDWWQARRELRESRDRSDAVLAALEEGIVFCGPDGSVVESNTSAARILGTGPDQVFGPAGPATGHLLTDETGHPIASADRPGLATLRTGEPRLRTILGFERPNRETVWLELSALPLRRPEREEPYGVVISFADVTDRRRREQARERQLTEATAHLKVLSGLLPICASCKRIRDEHGEWHQLERYIRSHAEVEFTHGLCPTCLERLEGEGGI